MCWKGTPWATADKRAGEIVELARHRIGLSHFPSWIEARGETPQEREFWFCATCGGFMKAHNRPWCSEECRAVLRLRQRWSTKRRGDLACEKARRVMLTGGAELVKFTSRRERRCKGCAKVFVINYSNPRTVYCSHRCWSQRWLGKFGQQDKWTFCLTTAQDAEIRREYEQTNPPEP